MPVLCLILLHFGPKQVADYIYENLSKAALVA
jgi:hypothetical protein